MIRRVDRLLIFALVGFMISVLAALLVKMGCPSIIAVWIFGVLCMGVLFGLPCLMIGDEK